MEHPKYCRKARRSCRAGGVGHIDNVISRGVMNLGRKHAGRILGKAVIKRGIRAIKS
jgi:hypothetical protein